MGCTRKIIEVKQEFNYVMNKCDKLQNRNINQPY